MKTKIKTALAEHKFVPQSCIYWGHFFHSSAIAQRDDTLVRLCHADYVGTEGADHWRVKVVATDGKAIEKTMPLRAWAGELGVVFP